jgi:hypothetical protein
MYSRKEPIANCFQITSKSVRSIPEEFLKVMGEFSVNYSSFDERKGQSDLSYVNIRGMMGTIRSGDWLVLEGKEFKTYSDRDFSSLFKTQQLELIEDDELES